MHQGSGSRSSYLLIINQSSFEALMGKKKKKTPTKNWHPCIPFNFPRRTLELHVIP